MKIDLNRAKEYQEKGLITIRKHNTSDLYILNYTSRCSYDNIWDDFLIQCRGLIVDSTGEVKARPFPKFFNLGQKLQLKDLPDEEFEVTEKLDGSLGISYIDDEGMINIATRGSFHSPQAQWATEWLKGSCDLDLFKSDWTYLFEIVYPENRIVIDYHGKQGLILLAMIRIDSDEQIEMDNKELQILADEIGCDCVKQINGKKIEDLLDICKTLSCDEEGFVVKFLSDNFRIKLKGEEYMRLHKILSGINEKFIWERLMLGLDLKEALELVPDEFANWVKEVERKFKVKWAELFEEVYKIVSFVKFHKEAFENRKDKAEYINSNCVPYLRGACFAMLDGRLDQCNRIIFKTFEPKGCLTYKGVEDGGGV